MSDITDFKKPWSPQVFRVFRLHRVIYTEESTLITQVAYPRLGGKTKSHLLNFQKQQLIPELREHSMVLAALAEADDGHWNITNDPIYPTCLEGFRRRHESSQASQASKSAERSGTGGGSPTQEMGFIWEVDRALAKSIMAEFLRLQLIVGNDLNTSLRAMHADLEATTAELVRDMDIASENSTALPSMNPARGVALHRFTDLVRLKLALPLAQVDAA